ncbi:MAG: GNAT family N-acetyltransferase [Bryobacteraceae bacterium]|jgi:CelD/BcsL family acetyltransferase involved in cellulose biosynthesis
MTSPQTSPAPEVRDVSGPAQATWIATTGDFKSLRSEWTELFEATAPQCVFLSFEWMFTWWKHWGKSRELAMVAVRDSQGRLVGLAPFSIERNFPAALGARRLSFLADAHVGSDYLGILARPGWEQAAVDTIASAVWTHRREWDYIELSDAEDGPLLASLCARLEAIGMSARKAPASVCHFIPLPASFDAYLAGIGINLRSNYRRRWRVLERKGPAEVVTLSDIASLERHFPELLRLHRMRFEHQERESAFTKPGVPAFHVEVLGEVAARGWARLFLLRASGQTVAALYGFSIGNTFQFYQCGMHPAWLSLGVGQLIVGGSIQEAIRAGHAEFDFLRGDEQYKTQWAEQSRWTVTVRLFDRRPASLAARIAYGAAAALRKAKRRIASARAQAKENT